MHILGDATVFHNGQPLAGGLAAHLTALESGHLGFTQPRPPRLLVTLYPTLESEQLSTKLLELLATPAPPTLLLDSPAGLVACYLLEHPLEEHRWQQLNKAIARRHHGTPAALGEILPLPSTHHTLLHTSATPLSYAQLCQAYSVEPVAPPSRAHHDSELQAAIARADLPALVAERFPESGARAGTKGAVKAVWRGDSNPSFSLWRAQDGTWLFKDHGTGQSGNAFGWLVDICGLDKREAAEVLTKAQPAPVLPPPAAPVQTTQAAAPAQTTQAAKPKERVKSKQVATYPYVDETGKLLFEVVRFEPKRFVQRRRAPQGGWLWGLKAGDYTQGNSGDWVHTKDGETGTPFPACRIVLYRLPELLVAVHLRQTVLMVEGEKDVHTLMSHGFTATCCPMGAGKWQDALSEPLRGANVVILPDNDPQGKAHAEDVSKSLQGIAASVTTLWLPELMDKGDVSDWLEAGHTPEELKTLLEPKVEQTVTQEEMQQELWKALNARSVPSFTHPSSRYKLSPENATACLQSALEQPNTREHQRVISEAYSALQGATGGAA